ncbi:MAG: hypothetical protein ACRDNS_18845, partial [Trebonia sp.]
CLKQKQKREARAEMQHSLHVIRSNNLRTGPGSFERAQLNKAAWGAIGSWQQKVADDPPVKSFAKVASRGRARLRWMPPPSRLSGPERRIAAYLERAGGAVAAMVASINRANGAFAATLKNPSADRWTTRQNTAADEDALAAYSDLNSALSVDDTTPTLGAALRSAIGRFARLMNTIG